MTERMASYDVIIPRVLMQVQPCPQFVVLDAVQQVAVDFFTRTEVWTGTMAETLFRGSRVVELTADRGVVVSRVLHLLLDGVRLEGGSDFHAERAGSGITVLFHAAHEDADHTVYAYCAFRPARTAAQVPEALLEEWGDTLVFGSLATFVGASITWKLRRRPAIALMGPVLANALIVPAYLPLLLQGIGFYTIPFTSISLDGTYPLMYLFGLVTTGLGEAVIMYLLGYPLARSLAKTPLIKRELAQTGTNR